MKVIIAGSRTINAMDALTASIRASGFKITEVVSGGADGVDRLGERWALAYKIPVVKFPAPWAQHGRAAGPIRNKQMAEYSDALICVWDGVSQGSRNMIREARKAGIPVFEVVL